MPRTGNLTMLTALILSSKVWVTFYVCILTCGCKHSKLSKIIQHVQCMKYRKQKSTRRFFMQFRLIILKGVIKNSFDITIPRQVTQDVNLFLYKSRDAEIFLNKQVKIMNFTNNASPNNEYAPIFQNLCQSEWNYASQNRLTCYFQHHCKSCFNLIIQDP